MKVNFFEKCCKPNIFKPGVKAIQMQQSSNLMIDYKERQFIPMEIKGNGKKSELKIKLMRISTVVVKQYRNFVQKAEK